MKALLLSLGLSALAATSAHATWDGEWAHAFGDDLSSAINGVDTDSFGNVYITGYFSGVISIAGGPPLVAQGTGMVTDVFVAKLSPTGGARVVNIRRRRRI